MHLVDPNRRAWLLGLSEPDFERMRGDDELGIALVDPSTLKAPLWEYEVIETRYQDNDVFVTIEHEQHRLTFPMEQFSGYWYFGLGKVKRKGEGF